MKTETFSLKLEAADLEQLRRLQEATGGTIAEHVRRAIGAYLAAGPATRGVAAALYGNEARSSQRRRRS